MYDAILSILSDGFFAAIAAVGFALISNPQLRSLPIIALLAALGHAARFVLITHASINIVPATMLASLCIGVLSLIPARRYRISGEFLSFPALLPMIPGLYAYKSIISLLLFISESDSAMDQVHLVNMFHNGIVAFLIMTAIIVGALLPLFVVKRGFFSRLGFLPPR